MARPIRVAFELAVSHATARGDVIASQPLGRGGILIVDMDEVA